MGISATVFERAPELQEVGAGISLGANGMYALTKLGVADAVRAVGSPAERIEIRAHDGATLSALTSEPLERQLRVVTTIVHRAALHAALAEALNAGTIRLGSECVGFMQDDTGVTAQFATGEEAHGTLLIGADGLFSAVRAQLSGHQAAALCRLHVKPRGHYARTGLSPRGHRV